MKISTRVAMLAAVLTLLLIAQGLMSLLAVNSSNAAIQRIYADRTVALVQLGEVRSVVGRSADAAREIKSLIGTSVERLEQGSALVDRAGSTMSEVVSSLKSQAQDLVQVVATFKLGHDVQVLTLSA